MILDEDAITQLLSCFSSDQSSRCTIIAQTFSLLWFNEPARSIVRIRFTRIDSAESQDN